MKSVKKITSDVITWDAILPCPFCSAPGEVITCKCSHDERYASSSFVQCTRCGAAGSFVEPDEYVFIDVNERIAIKKWNKRGNISEADRKLVRIAKILNGIA